MAVITAGPEGEASDTTVVNHVNGETSTLSGRFDDGTNNVLLLVPHMAGPADDGCADLLSVERPAAENALVVTLVQSPRDRMAAWEARAGDERPATLAFVDAGGTGSVPRTDGGPRDDVRVETVGSPGNLTDMGIKISTALSGWQAAEERTVLCFHSLSTLLQYADLQRVFRFLHVLTGRVRAVDGFAHYHMDPGTHDERVRSTLMTLFDGLATWDGEDWSVRNR